MAALTVGCGQRKPSREEAAQLIGGAAAFTNEAVVRTAGLYRGRCIMRQFDLDADENRRYQQVAAAGERVGWLRLEKRKATEKECGWLFASTSDVVAITLTEEGRKAQNQWPGRPVGDVTSQFAQKAPDWNLPLQRRQFVEVTGVADPNPSTGEVQVEFKWQIVWPLGGTPDDKRGVATFRHYDTGWRVEKMDGLS